MAEATLSQDPLTQFVSGILDNQNMTLSSDQKDFYIPQFVEQLEQRIGLELLPKLSEEKQSEFADLLDRDSVSPREVHDFWQDALPTFEQDVKDVMQKFAQTVEQILQK